MKYRISYSIAARSIIELMYIYTIFPLKDARMKSLE
jgi:hypothetical protein